MFFNYSTIARNKYLLDFVKYQNLKLSNTSDLSFFYSNERFRKNSSYSTLFKAIFEINEKYLTSVSKRRLWIFFKFFVTNVYGGSEIFDFKQRELGNILFFDMIGLYKAWRHIRGYPVNGQRTWSNGKSVTKNNTVFRSFRLQQFYTEFGTKKRTSFQILLNAEYNNRLWQKTWIVEWTRAKLSMLRTVKGAKKKVLTIDMVSLAKGITTGYARRGKAIRYSRGKKALKMLTVGLPIYFTRYLFSTGDYKKFPYEIRITQEEKHVMKRRKKKTVKGKNLKKKSKAKKK